MSSEDGLKVAHENKATRHRSPNYPVISLRKAVERAKELNEKYKRTNVPVAIAQERWGYKSGSSSGNQCVAALKSFGLLEVEGTADGRKVRVSDSAYRIIMESKDAISLLQNSMRGPAIYAELLEKYGGEGVPESEIIRHYLLLDRADGTFNEDVVDTVIANFVESLEYAGLVKDDIKISKLGMQYVGSDETLEPCSTTKTPALGDMVNWWNGKDYEYPQPRRVQGVKDGWVFIEGDDMPRPIDDVVVPPGGESLPVKSGQMPPPNPFAGRSKDQTDCSVPPLTFPLPRGNVIEIRLKSKVTAKEFQKIKALIDLSESSFVEDEKAGGGQ